MSRSRVRRPTRTAPHRNSRRPRLERLEDRLAMAVRVWDGGAVFGDNWTDARNWEDNIAPVAGDSLFFPADVGALDRATTNDFPSGTTFARITFTGDGYSLTGHSIKLGQAGPGTSVLVSNVAGDTAAVNTVNLFIQVISDTNFVGIGKNETLRLSGGISGNGGLTTNGEGKLILSGSGPNSYQGETVVRSGVLQLEKTGGAIAVPTALTISTDFINPEPAQVVVINNEQIASVPVTIEKLGTLTLASTETVGLLTLNGGQVNGSGTLVLGGQVIVNNEAGDTSSITVPKLSLTGSARRFTVGDSTTGPDLTISSVIGGSAGLVKAGPGALRMTGAANTYTGTTTIEEGLLDLQKSGVAIPGPLVIGLNSLTTAEAIMFSDQLADTTAVTVHRHGLLTITNQPTVQIQSLTLLGGSVAIYNGLLSIPGGITTFASDRTATISKLGSDGRLSLGVTLASEPPPTSINVADGSALVDLEITAPLAGVKGFRKSGFGTLQLSGNNRSAYGEDRIELGTVLVDGNRALSAKVTQTGGKLLVDGVNDLTDVVNTVGQFGGSGVVKSLKLNGFVGPSAGLADATSQTLQVLGTLEIAPNAFFDVDLHGLSAIDRDLITTGDLRLTNPDRGFRPLLNLRLPSNFDPAVGTRFTILRHLTGTQTVGIFSDTEGNPLPEGAGFVASGKNFVISYLGGAPENREIVVTRDTAPAFANRSLTSQASEGGLVTLAGTITEPDAGDAFQLVVNWGDNTPVETFTFPPGSNGQRVAVTHRYADNGRFNVSFTWSDPHGGAKSDKLRVVVTNVAPQLLDLALSEPRLAGRPVTLTGRIADPGHDSFTLRVIWGDGSVENRQFPAGTQQFSLTHTYQRNARFQINLVLIDDDGGGDTEQLKLQIGSQSPSAAAIDAVLAAGLDFTTNRSRRR